MKIYLIISLFSLIVSQQCIAGTNCPFNQGFCSGDTCQCLEGYKTFYDKSLPLEKQIFCNYKQIDHYIPLVLEFLPTFGSGHFYIGRYIQGCIKLILEATFLSANYYIYKELQFPHFLPTLFKAMLNSVISIELRSTGNKVHGYEIAQFIFLFTFWPFWILWAFDLIMFFNNKYYDGNGIPLV